MVPSTLINKRTKGKCLQKKQTGSELDNITKNRKKTLVSDEQLDNEVPETDESVKHGVLLGPRLWNSYNGLAAKTTPKKVWDTTIT